MWVIIPSAVLGWLCGAAVNFFADVLPARQGLLRRPFCPGCRADYPLLGYLVWLPACAACGQRRPGRAWLVQIFLAAAAGWLVGVPAAVNGGLPGLAVISYFTLIAVIDIEHRLILHPVSAAGAALGAAFGWMQRGWQATLLGGLAGAAFLLGLYLLGALLLRLLRRWRTTLPADEEALGFGDVTLGAVLGLILGWPGILAGVFLAVLLAGAASLLVLLAALLRRRYHAGLAIPYGPFMVLSAALLLFFRDGILAIFGR